MADGGGGGGEGEALMASWDLGEIGSERVAAPARRQGGSASAGGSLMVGADQTLTGSVPWSTTTNRSAVPDLHTNPLQTPLFLHVVYAKPRLISRKPLKT